MTPSKTHNPKICPLCGWPNYCLLCEDNTRGKTCWCARVEVPAAVLAQVPEQYRNKACICRTCVTRSFPPSGRQSEKRRQPPPGT